MQGLLVGEFVKFYKSLYVLLKQLIGRKDNEKPPSRLGRRFFCFYM